MKSDPPVYDDDRRGADGADGPWRLEPSERNGPPAPDREPADRSDDDRPGGGLDGRLGRAGAEFRVGDAALGGTDALGEAGVLGEVDADVPDDPGPGEGRDDPVGALRRLAAPTPPAVPLPDPPGQDWLDDAPESGGRAGAGPEDAADDVGPVLRLAAPAPRPAAAPAPAPAPDEPQLDGVPWLAGSRSGGAWSPEVVPADAPRALAREAAPA